MQNKNCEIVIKYRVKHIYFDKKKKCKTHSNSTDSIVIYYYNRKIRNE